MKTASSKNFHSFYLLLFLVFSFSLTSCKDKSIGSQLNIDCNNTYEFTQLKSTKDTKGNFEMKIPVSWKKEMFVNQNETRLYFADTTRQLNETFIIDIGLYFSNTKIDSNFIRETKKQIQQNSNLTLVKERNIIFKEKPGFAIQTNNKELGFEKSSIDIYLKNKNDSYYILKIDTYGNENIEERFCEALQILNYIDFC